MCSNPVALLPDVVPDANPSATEWPSPDFCIYTRRCTRRTPLCYRMLSDVRTVLNLRIYLFLNKYSRLVAFRSRGVYIWYNVWYKCQILPKRLWPGGSPCGCHSWDSAEPNGIKLKLASQGGLSIGGGGWPVGLRRSSPACQLEVGCVHLRCPEAKTSHATDWPQ